jgi:hypothetical protein
MAGGQKVYFDGGDQQSRGKTDFSITVHNKIHRNLVLSTSKVANEFVVRASFVSCPVVLVTLVKTHC